MRCKGHRAPGDGENKPDLSEVLAAGRKAGQYRDPKMRPCLRFCVMANPHPVPQQLRKGWSMRNKGRKDSR